MRKIILLLLHKWITLYDVLLSFLLLLLYTTTYTIIYSQVCASEMYDHFMILYSKLTTVRESGASKNGENFLFFCVFFEKKKDELLFFDDCMSFFWVYFWFLDKKVLLMTDFYHYCAEKFFCLQVIRRLFVRQIEKKKNTYYLLILVNMNYCLSLWFKLTTEKNVCLNENKTKIKNKRTFWDEHWKKTRFLTIMLITN